MRPSARPEVYLSGEQLVKHAVAVGLEQLAEAAERAAADQHLGEGHLAGEGDEVGAAVGVLREVDLLEHHAARLKQRLSLPAEAARLRGVDHDVRHPGHSLESGWSLQDRS